MTDITDELLNSYYEGMDLKTWKKEEGSTSIHHSYYDIVDIQPEDAKSINEIKSFTISHVFHGDTEFIFTRKG